MASATTHPDTNPQLVKTLKDYNSNRPKPPLNPSSNSATKNYDNTSSFPNTLNNGVTKCPSSGSDQKSSATKVDKAAPEVEQFAEKGLPMKVYVDEISSPIVVTRVTLHPDDLVQVSFYTNL